MTRRPSAKTSQAAAAKAIAAADALMAWLQTQPRETDPDQWPALPAAGNPLADVAGTSATAGTTSIGAAVAMPLPSEPLAAGVSEPRRDADHQERNAPQRLPSCGRLSPSRVCALAHTDWLHHRLSITGPTAELAAFRVAAAGAGTIPWHLDLDQMAEDFFHLLAAPPARSGSLIPPARSLSLAGARILADQLCAAVARRHALAIARVGHSRAFPLDLHALVPVPDPILRQGPDDPASLDWLWTHWGTTQALRHVADDEMAGAAIGKRLAAGEAVWAMTFWSADWTPWRAFAQISAHWPALRLEIHPTYETL
jgi:hypothetical protein